MSETEPRRPASPLGGQSFGVGRIQGIEIRLDPSLLIIFMLIVISLARGVFPAWHPEWSGGTRLIVALVAGVLFLASVLAHELSHAVVAKRFGIAVPTITLFLFGGMAAMERDPDDPRSEFWVAIAGPLMSLAIGIGATAAGVWLAPASFAASVETNPERAMAELGVVATVVLWLGPVNLVLAAFNMIPGFPLDGGRVFRAAVWWFTGDAFKATRWAARVGVLFAWALMTFGALQLIGGQWLNGLWLMFIGWFLNHLANRSYEGFVMQRSLARVTIGDVMRTRFEHVAADVSLDTFVAQYLLRNEQLLWPVMADGGLAGFVTFSQLARLAPDERRGKRVGDIMRAPASAGALSPEQSIRRVLDDPGAAAEDPLPVMQGGRLVGLLHRSDVLRWLALHGNRDPRDGKRADSARR